MSVTDKISDLVLANGAINPMAYKNNHKDKLAALRTLFPPEDYNVVLFSEFLMSHLPAGVSLVPQIIEVSENDVYDEVTGLEIGIAKDHAMLKVEKIISLGQATGIKLERVGREEIEINGLKHLEITYVASMILPNGVKINTPPIPKALPMMTKHGKQQAHLNESVDKKAQRNAIKYLLNLPTQMLKSQALKMWVCLKPVFAEGAPVDKTVTGSATAAADALYGENTKSINLGPSQESILEKLENCKTQEDVQSLSSTFSQKDFDQVTFEGLRAILGRKWKELGARKQ
ncbi:hypothetical protein [Leptospira adleri]|uniref:Uncharacterized protein n=1 Tax=Leptospira adleri TaxID=2023186 RepID=A0A2M9YJ99_9LEPT|nr:hypothetical protein [Leptospira adleri]PJZ51613.1 hypothetical protein CH380_19395 [Leptospira adleri]PJZ61878.1 hypothetical protein CH376_10770 [Leptospira adleri]